MPPTYDVAIAYVRSLPPMVGEQAGIELDGGRRWIGEQIVTVGAVDELEAIDAATPYFREGKILSIEVGAADRWTVSGDVLDRRQHGRALYSNGETYATKREARDAARFACDVIDRRAS
jgi:hypothetical protein